MVTVGDILRVQRPEHETYNPLHDELSGVADGEAHNLEVHVNRCAVRYASITANQIENRNIQKTINYRLEMHTRLLLVIGAILVLKGIVTIEDVRGWFSLLGF